MLRMNTDQMIKLSFEAINEYDKVCQGFLASAGAKGVYRKAQLQKILTESKHSSPEELFNQLYDFYKAQTGSSRLRHLLEVKLKKMLGMELMRSSIGTQYEAGQAEQLNKRFHKAALENKKELGLNNKDGAILLKTFSR
jgi:hypothetical protein